MAASDIVSGMLIVAFGLLSVSRRHVLVVAATVALNFLF